MKRVLIVLLTIVSSSMFAQRWTKLPNSDIKFSDFQADSSIRWNDYSFEYFLKGDRMLSISKGIAEDFKLLLIETPRMFDDLYNCAYNVAKKEDIPWSNEQFGGQFLDTLIRNVSFKSTVIIDYRTYYIGVNESIWILSNPSAPRELGGCYLKIVFNIKGKKRKYLKADKDRMVI